MKKEIRNANRMQFKNGAILKKYLKAKEDRDNRLWKMVDSSFVTFFSGQWISLKEFEQQHPILTQTSLLTNMDNPNKKNNYSL